MEPSSTEKTSTRGIEGILVVDKPVGITSHDTVERIRRLFRIRRVGHTGTLDPFARGVLVMCIGRATRIARYFEGLDKAYRAVLKLGVSTDTGDAEGEPAEVKPVPELSTAMIEAALSPQRGTITQRPPAYSAVRVGGERLYAKARRGEKVAPPEREVTIYALELESFEGDELELAIECSKGTYVRSLAYDVGRALGCGAYCKSLVRTRVGDFSLKESSKLEELEMLGEKEAARRILETDEALKRFMEPVILTSKGALLISHGNPVEEESIDGRPKAVRPGTTYRALDETGRLIALVEPEEGPRGLRFKPSRVLAH